MYVIQKMSTYVRVYRDRREIKDLCSPGRILAKRGERASHPADGNDTAGDEHKSTLSPFSEPARLAQLLISEESNPTEGASVFCSKDCRLRCPNHVSLQDLSSLLRDVYDNKALKTKSARQEKLRTYIRDAPCCYAGAPDFRIGSVRVCSTFFRNALGIPKTTFWRMMGEAKDEKFPPDPHRSVKNRTNNKFRSGIKCIKAVAWLREYARTTGDRIGPKGKIRLIEKSITAVWEAYLEVSSRTPRLEQ